MQAEWGLEGYEGLLVSRALAVFGLGGCCLKHTFTCFIPVRSN